MEPNQNINEQNLSSDQNFDKNKNQEKGLNQERNLNSNQERNLTTDKNLSQDKNVNQEKNPNQNVNLNPQRNPNQENKDQERNRQKDFNQEKNQAPEKNQPRVENQNSDKNVNQEKTQDRNPNQNRNQNPERSQNPDRNQNPEKKRNEPYNYKAEKSLRQNKPQHQQNPKDQNRPENTNQSESLAKIDKELKKIERDVKQENQPKQESQQRQENQAKSDTQNKPDNQNKNDNKNYSDRKSNHNRNRRRNFIKPEKFSGYSKPRSTSFKKVSVVIPLLNEEESLNILTNEVRKAIKNLNIDHEIIFINDGSTDNSLNIIKGIARTDKKIKYISFNKNYGKSAALQMGFKHASGDVVITMDADLQDDPNEIPNLIAKLEEGYDLVSGWKKVRHDPFVKKHSSKFFNFTTKVMSGIKIHDFNCGLKAYRSDVVKSLNVYGELHRYVPVLAGWNGYKISEIPVKHHARRFGETKFGISRFFKGFIDLLTVTFTTRYVKRPMHLFGFLGALSFLIGFLVNGYLSYEWFMGKHIGNRPLLFLGILLIIVGVQFFSVGLLGELLVHNTQSDREYVIKESNL